MINFLFIINLNNLCLFGNSLSCEVISVFINNFDLSSLVPTYKGINVPGMVDSESY